MEKVKGRSALFEEAAKAGAKWLLEKKKPSPQPGAAENWERLSSAVSKEERLAVITEANRLYERELVQLGLMDLTYEDEEKIKAAQKEYEQMLIGLPDGQREKIEKKVKEEREVLLALETAASFTHSRKGKDL